MGGLRWMFVMAVRLLNLLRLSCVVQTRTVLFVDALVLSWKDAYRPNCNTSQENDDFFGFHFWDAAKRHAIPAATSIDDVVFVPQESFRFIPIRDPNDSPVLDFLVPYPNVQSTRVAAGTEESQLEDPTGGD
nr:hypothetical protein Iba_chr04fCG10040 [Ipomoea batatas]